VVFTGVATWWLWKFKLTRQLYSVIFLLFSAFGLHFYTANRIFDRANHCKEMKRADAYITALPEVLIFSVFTWAIFKMLFIWRCLSIDTVEEGTPARAARRKEVERKRIYWVFAGYLVMWLFLWLVQRTLELKIVQERQSA
jgi:hypothetical protein